MTQPKLIHRHGEAYNDRNHFLFVALGAHAINERLQTLLDGCARLKSATPTDPEHDVVYFLLGLSAFANQAMDHLDGARQSPRQQDTMALTGDSELTGRQMLE